MTAPLQCDGWDNMSIAPEFETEDTTAPCGDPAVLALRLRWVGPPTGDDQDDDYTVHTCQRHLEMFADDPWEKEVSRTRIA